MIKTLISSAVLVVCAASAQGACTQADIAGTWTAYSISQDQTHQLAWTACNLVIGASGAFTTASSSCSAAGQTAKVQGSLKLSSAAKCAYSGSIAIPHQVTDPIPSLTLSLDKQTAMGAGGKNGTSDVFAFSMVKTK
jgi:hypothetical protein